MCWLCSLRDFPGLFFVACGKQCRRCCRPCPLLWDLYLGSHFSLCPCVKSRLEGPCLELPCTPRPVWGHWEFVKGLCVWQLSFFYFIFIAPNEKMKEVLKKTVEEAKAIVSKVSFSIRCTLSASVFEVAKLEDGLPLAVSKRHQSLLLSSLPFCCLCFCFFLSFLCLPAAKQISILRRALAFPPWWWHIPNPASPCWANKGFYCLVWMWSLCSVAPDLSWVSCVLKNLEVLVEL